eukprot:m.206664 g.206664  ORF g.206664 m.206664 type:complete len:69 (-) comp25361_c0_seq1:1110-1316(-)
MFFDLRAGPPNAVFVPTGRIKSGGSLDVEGCHGGVRTMQAGCKAVGRNSSTVRACAQDGKEGKSKEGE